MSNEEQVYPLSGGLNTACRFAVLGDAGRLKKHKHVWKVWRTLGEFGCRVYLVIPGLSRWEGGKIYPELSALTGKVDVVVNCLFPGEMPDLVAQVKACGCTAIWFQEQTWSKELQLQCDEEGIKTVRGCLLRHKRVSKPFGFFNPCYWHGLYEEKVPLKQNLTWKRK